MAAQATSRDTRDEVDLIVAAWQHEVPGLDVEPLRVLSRLTRLARHLDLARRTAFAEHGLEVWEFDVISALRRAGAPYELSPGDLVKQTLSTSGTMTNRVDRLARRGLVERLPDPDDRRGVRVRLTATGRRLSEDALKALLARERGAARESRRLRAEPARGPPRAAHDPLRELTRADPPAVPGGAGASHGSAISAASSQASSSSSRSSTIARSWSLSASTAA
jgi:DNA-binding MarR family transcriptional regulator